MTVSIARAFSDKRLFAASLGNLASWSLWLVVLKAAFGLQLSADELALFASVAGSRKPPTERVRELWCVVGRRGGKSKMAALIAVFIALFVKHRLSTGEVGMVLIVAGSMDQATVVFNYVLGILRETPALRKEIASVRRHEVTLRNGIVIAVHSNSFRNIRGRTLVAAIFDETGFWRDESSATPDQEVYSAVLPSLATTNGMLIGISTPYRRIGLLHQKFKDSFGEDDADVLVVQGGTTTFNPMLTEAAIAAQRAANPADAAEWDASFRDDIASFLDDELINAAVEHGRPPELPPRTGIYYRAFCDASGGVGADAYTIAIGHKQDGVFVVDVIRGTSGRFDPAEVTREYAALLTKEYRISTVTGDNYAAQWVAGAWQTCNVSYVRSELPKSSIYLETIPLFARHLVRLPDHPKLLRELRLLEKHTHRSGKDSIDHGRNGHDDYANAVCGVLRGLSNHLGYNSRFEGFQPDPVGATKTSNTYAVEELRSAIVGGLGWRSNGGRRWS